ncbi:MAG: hypothetical protein V4638_00385 [Bacteroidota bacterium]
MKKLLQGLLLCFAISSFSSCTKVEGEGGKSSISGNIQVEEKLYVSSNYSSSVFYPGAMEDVFIIYGPDGTLYDDKMECSFDGSFSFKYLRPGKYTIFGYNKIFNKGPNIANNDDDYYELEPVKFEIDLGKKESYVLDTIHLIR